MKKDFPGLTPQQLHNSVQNTIRIFNEYRLDKKSPINGAYRVYSANGDIIFFDLQYFPINEGTQLSVMGAPARGGDMTDEFGVETFFDRLAQVSSGQIVLTPDVVNRDVYKSGQGAIVAIWLIRLIIAIVAIIIGLMVLMR